MLRDHKFHFPQGLFIHGDQAVTGFMAMGIRVCPLPYTDFHSAILSEPLFQTPGGVVHVRSGLPDRKGNQSCKRADPIKNRIAGKGASQQ